MAAEAGLRPGDVVRQVNGREVASVSDFEGAIRQSGHDPVMLLVSRGGTTLYVVVEPR